jgi:hypothetical protein
MHIYDLIDGTVYQLRHIVYETNIGSANDRWVVGITENYNYVALKRADGSSIWERLTTRDIKRAMERLHDAVTAYLRHNTSVEPWALMMIADSKKLTHILYLCGKPPLIKKELPLDDTDIQNVQGESL